jgi:hypothetical protein
MHLDSHNGDGQGPAQEIPEEETQGVAAGAEAEGGEAVDPLLAVSLPSLRGSPITMASGMKKERKFKRLDFVNITGGPHAGEKGRIWELFDIERYGVKVMTGPEKDQQGTFVAHEKDLELDEEAYKEWCLARARAEPDVPIAAGQMRSEDFGYHVGPPSPPSPNHVWDQATQSWQELGEGAGVFIDVDEVDDLIGRLFIRARIRRSIPNRKSVQEHKADRLALLLEEAGFTLTELLKLVRPIADGGFKEIIEALQPFADCIEHINPEEDDEEWAKFRLLIKHYRKAATVFQKLTGPTTQDAEPQPEQQDSEQP